MVKEPSGKSFQYLKRELLLANAENRKAILMGVDETSEHLYFFAENEDGKMDYHFFKKQMKVIYV